MFYEANVSAVKTHYTLQARDDFIHVELETGFQISLASMQALWAAVRPLCEQRQTRRVLVEGEYPTRKMRLIDAHDHGKLIAALKPHVMRIAFCLYQYQPDELSKLFTLTANRRDRVVRFFVDLDDAFKWLQG